MATLAVPEFAVRVFDSRWELVTQQLTSKLRDRCTVDDFSGKQKVYNDLNTLTWQEDVTRIGDSDPEEVTGDKRVLTKRDFSCQAIFGRNDSDYLVKELTTPGSDTEQAMRASWARSIDDLIIAGATGTVYGGAEPYTTAITLPAGNTIDVDLVATPLAVGTPANCGLTPTKLMALARVFESNDVMMGENTVSGSDPMKVYLAIGPVQKENLWWYVTQAPNAPWANMVGEFLTGKSSNLFGFHALVSNRLPSTGTVIRSCIAWSPMGIKIVPDKYRIEVDALPNKKHAIQLSAYSQFGVMRRYENHVGVILCDESL